MKLKDYLAHPFLKEKVLPWLAPVIAVFALAVSYQTLRHYRQRDVPLTPELQLEASVDTRQGLMVKNPHIVEFTFAEAAKRIRRATVEMMLMSDMAKAFVTEGFIQQAAVDKAREDARLHWDELCETTCILPLAVRVRNNGHRDTTIEECLVDFPTHGGGILRFSTDKKINLEVPASKVRDLDLEGPNVIEVPIVALFLPVMFEVFAMGNGTAIRRHFDARSEEMKLDTFVDPSKEATVTVKDQFGSVTSTKIPITAFVEVVRASMRESAHN